jgi:hypothetical protein
MWLSRKLLAFNRLTVRRLLSVICAALLFLALGASTAFAGEVKGPPNQIHNTNETGALDHAIPPAPPAV